MKNGRKSNVTNIDFVSRSYAQLTTYFDRKYQLAWCYMRPSPRTCFTPQLLSDLNAWCDFLRGAAEPHGVKYHVIASTDAHAFNLGGDLGLFRSLSQAGDRDGLVEYARASIDALYANLSGFDQGVTTISLVRGSALGGGFEAALSSDVLIAERDAQMGFPEVLFNLFPGMGAYSFLARKIGAKNAERMILSGKVYSATELQAMGVIDVLVEPGQGEPAVYDYIRREDRARNGFCAMRKVRDYCDPISYKELIDIAEIWVDTAMQLTDRDLRMMERLVKRQSQRGVATAAG